MENEIRRVLCHYDLGELQSASRIERGFVNENWMIETTGGRYFLKRRHPDLRNPRLILAQQALVGHLRAEGFPGPAILKTLADETLLILDGEFYEIQEFIDGTFYQPGRPAHFEEAAVTLGHYHTCVQGYEPEALQGPGNLYDPAILRAYLSELEETWEIGGDPFLEELVQELYSHAADLAVRFTRHRALPCLVIHGDYHAHNLIFEGDRIVGVVDYDKARWQPRVVELAEALIYFASPSPGHMRHVVYPGFLQWDKFSGFLQCYALGVGVERSSMHRAAPIRLSPGTGKTAAAEGIVLRACEAHALPDYIRSIWLSCSIRPLLTEARRPSEASEALREVLALGDWSAANVQKMIALLSRAAGETFDLCEG